MQGELSSDNLGKGGEGEGGGDWISLNISKCNIDI